MLENTCSRLLMTTRKCETTAPVIKSGCFTLFPSLKDSCNASCEKHLAKLDLGRVAGVIFSKTL